MQPWHALSALPQLTPRRAPRVGVCCPQQRPCHCPEWGHAVGRCRQAPCLLGSELSASRRWVVLGGVTKPARVAGLLWWPWTAPQCFWHQFSCRALLPSRPWLVSPQTSDPMGSLQSGSGWSRPKPGGCVGTPPARAHTLLAPQGCREQEERSMPVQAAGIAKGPGAGLCVLGPWGEGGGWSPVPEAMGPTRPSPAPSAGDATPHSQGCPGMGLGRV